MLAVFIKEFRSYFQNITGFIFMGFFLLVSGIFFVLSNLMPASPHYNSVLGNITFIFLILVPILTMRLLSEEARQKTNILLLTSPLSLTGIVLGKYFAAQAVFLLTLIITFIYPVLLSLVGTIVLSEIVGGYIGLFLLGSTFIAIGLFVSSMTDNQVISAVITFGVLLFIWVLDILQQGMPGDSLSGIIFAAILALGAGVFVFFTTRNIFIAIAAALAGGAVIVITYLLNPTGYEGLIVKFLQWFSLLKRNNEFNMGLLGISPIIYYISFSSAFIFLTVRVIEKKRWR